MTNDRDTMTAEIKAVLTSRIMLSKPVIKSCHQFDCDS